jgi:hypothetical protein
MKSMNRHLSMFIAFSFAICAFLFTDISQTARAQSQTPQTPIKIGEKGVGGNRPPETLESKVLGLIRRIEALEVENKELKQQMFAAKLLISGLDNAFASHTHKLKFSLNALSLGCETSVGNCTVKTKIPGSYLFIPPGTGDISEKLTTTPPVKQ